MRFNPQSGLSAYEAALTILHRIGWRASVIYDKELYSKGYPRIEWSKTKWDSEEANGGNKRESPLGASC